MDLLSTFITELDLTVKDGTKEICVVSTLSLTTEVKQGVALTAARWPIVAR